MRLRPRLGIVELIAAATRIVQLGRAKGAPADRPSRPEGRADRMLTLLLAAAVALPLAVTATAAWLSWRQSWEEATTETVRAADAAAEYAQRLLDGLMIRLDRANDMLEGLSDEEIRAGEMLLHQQLGSVVSGGAPVAADPPAIVAFSRDAVPLVSSFVYPVPRQRSLAAEASVAALRGPDAPALSISAIRLEPTTGKAFFALARRRSGSGNDLPGGAYDGAMAARVYAEDVSAALRRLASGDPRDVVSLLRSDGAVLARSIGRVVPGLRVASETPVAEMMRRGDERALAIGRSSLDGEPRIAAYRRMPGYPVYVSVARPRAVIIERWWGIVVGLLAVGIPASLALLALAIMVRRRTLALARANAMLERRVEERGAALRLSESRLQIALDAAQFGSFGIDLRTGLGTRAGRSVPVRDFTLETYLRELVHPDDVAAVRAAVAGVAAGEVEGYRIEYRIRDGESWRWLESFGGVVERDADGRAIRRAGGSRDVTERKIAEAALSESEAEFRATFEESPLGKAQVDPATGRFLRVNATFCRLIGYGAEELTSGMTFSDITHPEDRGADAAAFHAAIARRGRYRTEKRYIRKDGTEIWVELSVALIRDWRTGEVVRTIGAAMDITDRKRSEERLALLAREVDHRAKNSLAVVQAALQLTPKHDLPSYAQAIEGRVSALARVQTLLAEDRWTGASVRALIEGELEPFLAGQRLEFSGPPIMLPAAMAQPVAMVVHEMATNAVKHGALSVPEGRVSVSWRVEAGPPRLLQLRWSEVGGPPVFGPPQGQGFGSRVLDATVRQQLGGRIRSAWEPSGVVHEIELPLGSRS
jgi:PAS domain S-box-containing protein